MRQLLRSRDRLTRRVKDWLHQNLGEDYEYSAVHEFLIPKPEVLEIEIVSDALLLWCLVPWMLYHYRTDPHGEKFDQDWPLETAAQAFLEAMGNELTLEEQDFLRATAESGMTFLLLEERHGPDWQARDILGRRHLRFKDDPRLGLERGDILYASLVPVGERHLLLANSPMGVDPEAYPMIVALRDKMESRGPVDGSVLLDYDIEVREVYLDLFHHHFHPPQRQLRNTDGDLIVECGVVGRLSCKVEEAFDRLKDLAAPDPGERIDVEEEALERAVYSRDGSIARLELPWIRLGANPSLGTNNTLVGNIVLREGILEAYCNSLRRRDTLIPLLEERLDEHLELEPIEEVEADEAQREEFEGTFWPGTVTTELEPPTSPALRQAQEAIQARLDAAWLDNEIPALGGRTPRQAVQDPTGLELLEALLLSLERKRHGAGKVAIYREQLGLAPPGR